MTPSPPALLIAAPLALAALPVAGIDELAKRIEGAVFDEPAGVAGVAEAA